VWGVLEAILTYLLERQHIIRASWSTPAIQFSKPESAAPAPTADDDAGHAGNLGDAGVTMDKREEEKQLSVIVKGAGGAVGSAFFWAYLQCLNSFSQVLGHMSHFCAGCVCHNQRFRDAADATQQQHRCPMRGRRGPELAAGVLGKFVAECVEAEAVSLILQIRNPALSEADLGEISRDFELGKQHILTDISLRASCYQQLPLKLLSIGHPEVSEVRRGIKLCLAMYDQLTPAAQSHPLVRTFLSPDGPLRPELILIAAGGHPDQCPEIKRWRTLFMLIPTIEINIERVHASLKRNIQSIRRHGPAYVSISIRKLELTLATKHDMKNLVAEGNLLQNARGCICALGLQNHLALQPYMQNGQLSKSLPHSLAVLIIYRCDLPSQFACLPAVGRHPSASASAAAAVAPAVADIGDIRPESSLEDRDVHAMGGDHKEDLLQHSNSSAMHSAKVSHFRSMVKPGLYFSMKVSASSALHLPPLAQIVRPTLPCSDSLLDHVAVADLDMLPQLIPLWNSDMCSTDDTPPIPSDQPRRDIFAPQHNGSFKYLFQEHYFFTVAMKNPAAQRTGVSLKTQSLPSHAMVIQLHSVVHSSTDMSKLVVNVKSPGSTNPSHAADALVSDAGGFLLVHDLHFSDLCSTASLWKPTKEVLYCFPGSEINIHAVSATVHALIARGAVEDSPDCISFDIAADTDSDTKRHTAALQVLEQHGFALCIERSLRSSSWILTTAGLQSMSVCHELSQPTPVMQARLHISPEQMTTFDLIMYLQANEWQLVLWSSTKKPDPVNARTGLPKKFYVKASSKSFKRLYLLALANLSAVQVPYVQHLEVDKYYKGLFATQSMLVESDEALIEKVMLVDDADADRQHAGHPPVVGRKRVQDGHRAVHEKTHMWGPGRLTFMLKGSAWQATCPRLRSHAAMGRGCTTKCKKRLCFNGPQQELQTLRRLRHWLNVCGDFGSRMEHQKFKATEVPDDQELSRQKLPDDYASDIEGPQGRKRKKQRTRQSPASPAPGAEAEAEASDPQLSPAKELPRLPAQPLPDAARDNDGDSDSDKAKQPTKHHKKPTKQEQDPAKLPGQRDRLRHQQQHWLRLYYQQQQRQRVRQQLRDRGVRQ
jgi:hypothetical protein